MSTSGEREPSNLPEDLDGWSVERIEARLVERLGRSAREIDALIGLRGERVGEIIHRDARTLRRLGVDRAELARRLELSIDLERCRREALGYNLAEDPGVYHSLQEDRAAFERKRAEVDARRRAIEAGLALAAGAAADPAEWPFAVEIEREKCPSVDPFRPHTGRGQDALHSPGMVTFVDKRGHAILRLSESTPDQVRTACFFGGLVAIDACRVLGFPISTSAVELLRLDELQQAERVRLLAEEAEPALTGPQQAAWLDRLDAEHAGLNRALRFYLADPDGVEPGLRLAGALARFWWMRGHAREGSGWAAAVLARPGGAPASRAKALRGAGALAYAISDYAAARTFLEASLTAHEAAGEGAGAAASLDTLGLVARERGDLAAARALHEEALARYRSATDRWGVASALGNLGVVARLQGDLAAARTLYEESLTIRRLIGDELGIASALGNLGLVARREGQLDIARAHYDESLAIRRRLGDSWGIAGSLNSLGALARQRSDWAAAQVLHDEAFGLAEKLGDLLGVSEALEGMSEAAAGRGNQALARQLRATAAELRLRIDAAPATEIR